MYTRATARTAARLEHYAIELASLLDEMDDEWNIGRDHGKQINQKFKNWNKDLKRIRKRLRAAAISYASACRSK
jgi:hypothetical protein